MALRGPLSNRQRPPSDDYALTALSALYLRRREFQTLAKACSFRSWDWA
jgi:hypothetical protein